MTNCLRCGLPFDAWPELLFGGQCDEFNFHWSCMEEEEIEQAKKFFPEEWKKVIE